MKRTMYLLLSLAFLVSCQNNCPENYTQNAPEIDTYKQGLAAYESQDWDSMSSSYSENAEIYFNATEGNAMSVSEMVDGHKSFTSQFSSYSFITDRNEYERVITDDGEMWVNFWGTWTGVVAATGKHIELPVHLTAQFVDGKIVKEYGFWNEHIFYLAFQEAEALGSGEQAEIAEE
jgi:ketosteroid isomerase-like protein